MGIHLSEREYVEDIELGAAIDDIKNPPTQRPSASKPFISPEEKLSYELFTTSPYQEYMLFGLCYIFRRVACHRRLGLEYTMYAQTKITDGRSQSDQIIAKKDYKSEAIALGTLKKSCRNLLLIIVDLYARAIH